MQTKRLKNNQSNKSVGPRLLLLFSLLLGKHQEWLTCPYRANPVARGAEPDHIESSCIGFCLGSLLAPLNRAHGETMGSQTWGPTNYNACWRITRQGSSFSSRFSPINSWSGLEQNALSPLWVTFAKPLMYFVLAGGYSPVSDWYMYI